MVLSVMPAACNLAIFSLAGFEKLHSNMAQVATVSLQPHWQPMWAPTRRTSTLGFSAAVSARARVLVRTGNQAGLARLVQASTTTEMLVAQEMMKPNWLDFTPKLEQIGRAHV